MDDIILKLSRQQYDFLHDLLETERQLTNEILDYNKQFDFEGVKPTKEYISKLQDFIQTVDVVKEGEELILTKEDDSNYIIMLESKNKKLESMIKEIAENNMCTSEDKLIYYNYKECIPFELEAQTSEYLNKILEEGE